jgi:hypothetical protein
MRAALRLGPAVAAAGLLVYAAAFRTWGLLYALGVHPYPAAGSTPWTYQMWSGIVPALTVISLFTALGGAWHLHNCHLAGCWRIGKHKIDGTPWCSRHMHLAPSRVLGRSDHDTLEEICGHLARVSKQLERRRWH